MLGLSFLASFLSRVGRIVEAWHVVGEMMLLAAIDERPRRWWS